MEKKQTAVEWLASYIKGITDLNCDKIIEQAKQMEKEQIQDAWDNRCSYGVVSQTWHIETTNGEQYYNETYRDKK
jgi:hypothetical protein